ncbi:Hypothetical predicted protein, partial [Olea europaea subsp. europaea]
QPDNNEYVDLDMFFMRCLKKLKRKSYLLPAPLLSSIRGDEISHPSKLNPLPPPKKRGEEKDEPQKKMTQKRRLILMKNIKPPHLKRQMTIDESLKKHIAANPIFSIKIIDV